MVTTRSSSKLVKKDPDKRRLRGPTCLRPLTKERLAALHPPRPSKPSKPLSPVRTAHSSKSSCFPKCVQTTYTLEIIPQANVSIIGDIEPAIRKISSPCGNFVWGHAKVVEVTDAKSDDPLFGRADANMVKGKVLHIILIHTNDNHGANLHDDTIATFKPTPWEPRDLMLERKEVISVKQILRKIRGWKKKVQKCNIIDKRIQEHLMMVAKGPDFPNGMGNDQRYPPPWDTVTWGRRVAERKAKELAYKKKPARSKKPPKRGLGGQWDGGNDADVPMPEATLANHHSSGSYQPSSSPISSPSEPSKGW